MWLMFGHAKREILPSRFVFLWPPPHWQSCYCNFIPSCSVVPELPCFLLDCHPCKHHVVWRLRQPVAIFPLPMLSEQRIYCTGRWLTNSPHLMSRAHQRLVVRLLPTLLCVFQQLSLYRCWLGLSSAFSSDSLDGQYESSARVTWILGV